jgi:hypothetical protein
MAAFSLALRLAVAHTASGGVPPPHFTIVASATNKPALLEFGFVLAPGVTTTAFSFGRPAANGVTPKESYNFGAQNNDGAGTSLTTGVAEWATPPTAPTNYLRRVSAQNAVSGTLWTFGRGLGIPVSGQLALYCLTTFTVPLDLWAVIDE